MERQKFLKGNFQLCYSFPDELNFIMRYVCKYLDNLIYRAAQKNSRQKVENTEISSHMWYVFIYDVVIIHIIKR